MQQGVQGTLRATAHTLPPRSDTEWTLREPASRSGVKPSVDHYQGYHNNGYRYPEPTYCQHTNTLDSTCGQSHGYHDDIAYHIEEHTTKAYTQPPQQPFLSAGTGSFGRFVVA